LGVHKLTNPAWTDGSGRGLLSFWSSALAPNAHGGSTITYEWYRSFLQLLVDSHAETWFSKLIASGETAVGLGLLVGALVPMAALGGLTMNMSYMLAGSASVNPVLALAAGVLLVGRGTSGVIGFDGLVIWLVRGRGLLATRMQRFSPRWVADPSSSLLRMTKDSQRWAFDRGLRDRPSR
jgi:thiosulfate dehydrogenase [quinone] large subunit